MKFAPVSPERVVLHEEGHRYVVGEGITERDVVSGSVVMANAGLVKDYSAVDPIHLAFRAEVGIATHHAAYLYLMGYNDPVQATDQLMLRAIEPHFEAFVKWTKKHKLVPQFTERPCYDPEREVCTTADFVGFYDGDPWIIDYKTTYAISGAVALQTMMQKLCFNCFDEDDQALEQFSYGNPYEPNYVYDTKIPLVRRGALHLPKRGPAKLIEFTDETNDYLTVQAMATVWHAKRRYLGE